MIDRTTVPFLVLRNKYWFFDGLFIFFVALTLSLSSCGGGGGSSSGNTPGNSDTTPPQIVSMSPADTATNIAVNSVVSVTFNEDMDASTINASTFRLTSGTAQIQGTVTYSNKTATFTPSGTLNSSTTYTASLSNVKDLAGNVMTSYTWSFSTASPADTTPPQIMSTSPADKATNIAVNSVVSVTFNEDMDASTINTSTFKLTSGTTQIQGMVTYSNKTVTFTPTLSLDTDTTYTASISNVKDLAGNVMPSYTWSFSTLNTLAKLELLKGKWHFEFQIATTKFTEEYTLTTITQGTFGYYLTGTNQYGGSAIGSYRPASAPLTERWSVSESCRDIFAHTSYFSFQTDGQVVLPGGCYHLWDCFWEELSDCYPLIGNKIN